MLNRSPAPTHVSWWMLQNAWQCSREPDQAELIRDKEGMLLCSCRNLSYAASEGKSPQQMVTDPWRQGTCALCAPEINTVRPQSFLTDASESVVSFRCPQYLQTPLPSPACKWSCMLLSNSSKHLVPDLQSKF